MENIIKVSDIYRTGGKITNPIECLFLGFCAKYLGKHGYKLSFEGVDVSTVKESNMFIVLQYYRDNIIGLELEDSGEYYYGRVPFSLMDKDFEENEPCFAVKDCSEWLFNHTEGGYNQNAILFAPAGVVINELYVNLVAYVTIHRLLNGFPKVFSMDFAKSKVFVAKTGKNWDIVDLFILLKNTNAIKSFVTLKLPNFESAISQLGFEAYYREISLFTDYSEYDLMEDSYEKNGKKKVREYLQIPVKLKIEEFKKYFQEGDICFLYKHDKGLVDDPIKCIKSCKIARIDKADKNGVTLSVLNRIDTPISLKKRVESMTDRARELYESDMGYYRKYSMPSESYSWHDIGVESRIHLEDCFIGTLNCDDDTVQWFVKDGKEFQLELSCPDSVYAILCEYGIEFNRERFEELYFTEGGSRYLSEVVGE